MNTDRVLFMVGNLIWLVCVVSVVVAIIYNAIKMKKEEK